MALLSSHVSPEHRFGQASVGKNMSRLGQFRPIFVAPNEAKTFRARSSKSPSSFGADQGGRSPALRMPSSGYLNAKIVVAPAVPDSFRTGLFHRRAKSGLRSGLAARQDDRRQVHLLRGSTRVDQSCAAGADNIFARCQGACSSQINHGSPYAPDRNAAHH
jgi:hypothetical protein